MHARLGLAAWFALLAPPSAAFPQARPRHGAELIFLVPSEPPSYDGHREGTFGVVHPLAPHYNTLLRIDPTDRTGTKPVADLAGRPRLHAEAAAGRALPRRRRDDLARRQGQLRQDHRAARGRHLHA